MKSITEKIIRIFEYFFGLIGVAMILVESYAVFARNVLQISTPWTDEALKLMFIWMIFVVSALAFYSDELICLTLVEDMERVKARPRIYGGIKAIQYTLGILLNILLCKQLVQILSTQFATGETTTVMKYPLWLLNVGLMAGAVLTILFGIMKVAETFKHKNTTRS